MTLTPVQYSKAQRRLLATLGGLGVAALAAGTFVLSYDDLRLLALRGGAARHWAFLYPGMVDGLVVVVVLALLSARRSGWFSRALRWLLLVVLIAGAGAAGIQRAVKGYAVLPDTPVDVGVAVAPWAILILAVWLWIAMFKQVLGRRSRRSGRDEPSAPAGPEAEPVPATVVDKSIIPGLDNDTRTLPRPAPVRELEPVREPALAPEPEENPWEAARLKPEPWEDDTEPVPATPSPEPAAWDEVAGEQPPAGGRRDPGPVRHAEPSDPVPASWRGVEEDEDGAEASDPEPGVPSSWRGPDTEELAAEAALAAADTQPSPVMAEPGQAAATAPDDGAERNEPLLAPTPRRPELNPDRPAEEAAKEPEPEVESPVNDKPAQPTEDEPRPRWVARTSLPTDVRLVGGPKPPLADTQPDGIKLPDTQPDGIPIMTAVEDDETDAYTDERAEDPEAGMESNPPSGSFRSGPVPPRG